jgi:hypothetical protein
MVVSQQTAGVDALSVAHISEVVWIG